MKKLIKTLIISLFAVNSFAQKTFTEQLFRIEMKEYFDKGTEYLKKCPTEFVLIQYDGTTLSRDKWMSYTQGGKTLSYEFSDVTIKQVGSSALVTGKSKHSHIISNGKQADYNEEFSYTFVEQNGKWLMTSQRGTPIPISPKPIKSIIYHKVEDYAKWKAGFDSAYEFRKGYGEVSHESGTLADDPKTVYVIQEWKTMEGLKGILANPKLKEEMGKAGVISAPTLLIFDEKAKGN
jgi:hypothetical protein